MRATVMYGAGDVRIEDVPDAHLIEPTDALVAVARAAICGSDLWPYKTMEHSDAGRRMGHEFIGVVEASAPTSTPSRPETSVPDAIATFFKNVTIGGGPAPVRAYIEELLPDVLD